MGKPKAVLAALLLAGAVLPAGADTLVIDAVQQAAGLERPAKGDSMTQVETRFGAPQQTHGAVGQPPITRWEYPQFTVYFEGDRVIHAVAKR